MEKIIKEMSRTLNLADSICEEIFRSFPELPENIASIIQAIRSHSVLIRLFVITELLNE